MKKIFAFLIVFSFAFGIEIKVFKADKIHYKREYKVTKPQLAEVEVTICNSNNLCGTAIGKGKTLKEAKDRAKKNAIKKFEEKITQKNKFVGFVRKYHLLFLIGGIIAVALFFRTFNVISAMPLLLLFAITAYFIFQVDVEEKNVKILKNPIVPIRIFSAKASYKGKEIFEVNYKFPFNSIDEKENKSLDEVIDKEALVGFVYYDLKKHISNLKNLYVNNLKFSNNLKIGMRRNGCYIFVTAGNNKFPITKVRFVDEKCINNCNKTNILNDYKLQPIKEKDNVYIISLEQ